MPNTTDYMILGYVFAFGILGITVGSIWWRYRAYAKTEALLAQLEAAETSLPPAASTPLTPSREKMPSANS